MSEEYISTLDLALIAIGVLEKELKALNVPEDIQRKAAIVLDAIKNCKLAEEGKPTIDLKKKWGKEPGI